MEGLIIILGIVLIAVLVWSAYHSEDLDIICSNPRCDYKGEGVPCGSKAGTTLLLTFFFLVPGFLYVLHEGPKGLYCPKCGKRVR